MKLDQIIFILKTTSAISWKQRTLQPSLSTTLLGKLQMTRKLNLRLWQYNLMTHYSGFFCFTLLSQFVYMFFWQGIHPWRIQHSSICCHSESWYKLKQNQVHKWKLIVQMICQDRKAYIPRNMFCHAEFLGIHL